MPRYEGMEDLLQRVRQRLGVVDAEAEAGESAPSADHNLHYTATLEMLLLLMRDAEKLHGLLEPEHSRRLTEQQHDELMATLGKVLRELWRCKAALERVKPRS
jgi:hypothetical protein